MSPIELIVIIVSALIVISVFGNMIYRKIKKKPSSECACCKARMDRMLKKMKDDRKNLH